MEVWTENFCKWMPDFFYTAMPDLNPRMHQEELMKLQIGGMNMYKDLIIEKDNKIAHLRRRKLEGQGFELLES
jgi:hypothetical protein